MSDFAAGMNAIGARFRQDTEERLERSRNALENWGDAAVQQMQETARWTDQSGDARELLHIEVEHPSDLRDGGQIKLAHGVFYGEFLEENPEFEIIQSTVETAGPDLLSELDHIW